MVQPVDVVGQQPDGDPDPAGTWPRIVQVHERITRRVDSVLHRRHGLSLTGFEALRRIAAPPEEWATMGELSEALGISRAGITSTVGRLLAVLGDDIGPVTEALARVSDGTRPGRRKASSP